MTEKMLDSIYGNDIFELVWENGQLGSSNRTTPKTTPNLCINGQGSSKIDFQFKSPPQSKNSLKKPIGEFPSSRPMKDSDDNHLCTYFSQHEFSPYSSVPLKKPRMDPSLKPITNSQKQNLGKVNFSNFLIPEVFLKSAQNRNTSATQPKGNTALSPRLKENEHSKVEKSTSSKGATDNSTVIESAKGSSSHVLTKFQGQTEFLTANKLWNPKPLVERSAAVATPLPLDEHSEAVSPNNSSHGAQYEAACAKGKAKDKNLRDQRAITSSSVCSIEASNNPNFGSKKHHEDTDDSAFLSDNDEDELEDYTEKEIPCRDGNRIKRSRNAEIHNLSERKRRDKINKKIRTLKELIPNCNKIDKASMLDDAIDYLKTLKLQLQIMSMGRGLCMPLMMPPQLPQLMGVGMGGIPCNPPQFSIPSLPGVTDNRVQMFGFSNQLQVPPPNMLNIPNAPFFPPIIGNSSSAQQPFIAAEPLANSAAPLTALEVSYPHNSNFYSRVPNQLL